MPSPADLYEPSSLLAHYTTADVAFGKVIPTGRLRLSLYSKMRDPLENRSPVFASISGYGGDDHDSQLELFWSIQGALMRARDDFRLLSLTQGVQREDGASDFGCGWARARMWEQYADNHRGVCLLFDREELVRSLAGSLGAQGQYWHGAVTYTAGGWATSDTACALFDDFRDHPVEQAVNIYVQKHFHDVFLLKTDDWESEAEYRFVLRPADPEIQTGDIFAAFRNALAYVVLGEKFPNWQVAGAQAVADDANVELRRMAWQLGHPRASRTLTVDEPWTSA